MKALPCLSRTLHYKAHSRVANSIVINYDYGEYELVVAPHETAVYRQGRVIDVFTSRDHQALALFAIDSQLIG